MKLLKAARCWKILKVRPWKLLKSGLWKRVWCNFNLKATERNIWSPELTWDQLWRMDDQRMFLLIWIRAETEAWTPVVWYMMTLRFITWSASSSWPSVQALWIRQTKTLLLCAKWPKATHSSSLFHNSACKLTVVDKRLNVSQSGCSSWCQIVLGLFVHTGNLITAADNFL